MTTDEAVKVIKSNYPMCRKTPCFSCGECQGIRKHATLVV